MIKPIDGFEGYYVTEEGKILSNVKMGGKRQYSDTFHEIHPRVNHNIPPIMVVERPTHLSLGRFVADCPLLHSKLCYCTRLIRPSP